VERPKDTEAKWWDVRKRGTLVNYTAKVAIAGVMLNFVADRVVDYSSDTVDDVVDTKTELIRQDIREPMDDVQKKVKVASESVENIEDGVEQMKQFLHDEFGIDFEEPQD